MMSSLTDVAVTPTTPSPAATPDADSSLITSSVMQNNSNNNHTTTTSTTTDDEKKSECDVIMDEEEAPVPLVVVKPPLLLPIVKQEILMDSDSASMVVSSLGHDRKRGRKRRKPEKIPVQIQHVDDVIDVTGQSTPSMDSNGDDSDHINATNATVTPVEDKAPSATMGTDQSGIIEHFRSFVERNSANEQFDKTRSSKKKQKMSASADLWQNCGGELQIALPPLHSTSNAYLDPTNVIGINGLIPERTMRQNNWALKVWKDWATNRNMLFETQQEKISVVPVDIHLASVESLSFWLPKFIVEVRRKDRKPYPADTLMQIASGLQRYLKQVMGRDDINFFDKYTETFAQFRESLRQRSGQLSQEASQKYKQMQVAGLNNEELWKSGYLNSHTAKGLFHVVFYYNCVEFEVTNMEEHHEMKVEQFKFNTDPVTNVEYMEFRRIDVKHFNSGGGATKRMLRYYANPTDARCMVKLYKMYIHLVPPTGPFYRRPLQTGESAQPRFSFNPVGINKLRETYKQMFTSERPACMRKSGKTESVMVQASGGLNSLHLTSGPSSSASSTPPLNGNSYENDVDKKCDVTMGGNHNNNTSMAMRGIYNQITEKLVSDGHIKRTFKNSPQKNNSQSPPPHPMLPMTIKLENGIGGDNVSSITSSIMTSQHNSSESSVSVGGMVVDPPLRTTRSSKRRLSLTSSSMGRDIDDEDEVPVNGNAPSSESSLVLQVPNNIRQVTVKQGKKVWTLPLI